MDAQGHSGPIRASDVPLDAWRLVSWWLDSFSLQNFRLTCKAFAEAAAPRDLAVRLEDVAHLSSAAHGGTVHNTQLDALPLLCKVR